MEIKLVSHPIGKVDQSLIDKAVSFADEYLKDNAWKWGKDHVQPG